MTKRQITMVIMDGYGLADPSPGNAVANAATPVLDGLFSKYPHTSLSASGEDVGLPDGQMGNSEVGHTNIGAGRVVYQDLPRITVDIREGGFFENEALLGAMEAAKKTGGAVHFMGLLSPGGVHSHIGHLFALIEMAKRAGNAMVYIHCFMDGRDVPPDSGIESMKSLVGKCRELGIGSVATVMGRFYAMDRDNRWDRVEQAYNAMVYGSAPCVEDPVEAVRLSYEAGLYDEFIKPTVCDKEGMIKSGDSVVFFNFRPDRAREITRAFVLEDFDGFPRKSGRIPIAFTCMTQYDEKIPGVEVAYRPEFPSRTLGEISGNEGLSQLRIAETEKYAHVTFFFNGGAEQVFRGEDRVLVPSPKEYPTYDLIPEMSARKVAEKAAEEIRSLKYDLVIINFANCDMVGHTGDYAAAVKAVETVDACLGIVKNSVDAAGGSLIVTADHGNAETMLDESGVKPHTAHTVNPVPFIVCIEGITLRPGRLCDVAPTILALLGLEKPEVMSGISLMDA